MKLRLFLASLAFLSASAHAHELIISSVDYGTPGDPTVNPLLPGEEGEAFLSFLHTGSEPLRDLDLTPYSGACMEIAPGSRIRIPEMAPQATFRTEEPLRVRIPEDCAREAEGSFLFLGTYKDGERQDRRIWAEGKFVVAPYPEVNYVGENLNLPIRDKSVTTYEIQVNSPIRIKEIGVSVMLDHTHHPDIAVKLVHPAGKTIVLFNKLSGSGVLNLSLGLGGTAFPILSQLAGLPAGGTWKLLVEDTANRDEGLLQRVGLRIK